MNAGPTLPCQADRSNTEETLEEAALACGRVLVADSHPTMLAGLRRLLEPAVKAVLMVSDEASLMAALEQFNPDLVIVDLSLPMRGDANVARLLKHHYPRVRVIILSVHDDSVAVEEVMAAGVEAFVVKQRAAIDLLPAISEVSQGRRYVSPRRSSREG